MCDRNIRFTLNHCEHVIGFNSLNLASWAAGVCDTNRINYGLGLKVSKQFNWDKAMG